jgi:hypothetical protein
MLVVRLVWRIFVLDESEPIGSADGAWPGRKMRHIVSEEFHGSQGFHFRYWKRRLGAERLLVEAIGVLGGSAVADQ